MRMRKPPDKSFWPLSFPSSSHCYQKMDTTEKQRGLQFPMSRKQARFQRQWPQDGSRV